MSSTWKNPVQIVMDSLTTNFKLYTLDKLVWILKIPMTNIDTYIKKWSIFDDQYPDL